MCVRKNESKILKNKQTGTYLDRISRGQDNHGVLHPFSLFLPLKGCLRGLFGFSRYISNCLDDHVSSALLGRTDSCKEGGIAVTSTTVDKTRLSNDSIDGQVAITASQWAAALFDKLLQGPGRLREH